MGNGQQLSLEILIKTIADSRGIATTDRDIKALADSMRSATAAGKPLETNTEAIAQALTKSGQAAQTTATSWDQFTDAQKSATREAAQSALRQLESAEAAKKGSGATRDLAKQLGGLKEAGSGANQVLSGLNQGGLTGLITAGRGAITVIKSLATGTIGGVLLPVIAAAGTAMLAFGKILSDNGAAMQKIWGEAKAATAAYKVELAKATDESNAKLDEHLAKIRQVSTALGEMLSDMDKAQARRAEIDAANKELELAKATTPEQKAEIEARYGQAALENKSINADLRVRNVNDTLQAARDTQRAAETDVAQAEAAFKLNPSKQTRDALTLAQQRAEKITQENAPIFKQGADQIDAAKTAKQVSGIQQQTFNIQQRNTGIDKVAGALADPSAIGALRQRAETAQASGNFAEQDKAVVELRKLTSAAKDLAKNVASSTGETTAHILSAAQQLKKQQQSLKNLKESRAGQ